MPDICPACGQPLPVLIRSADQLVVAMRVPPPPSDKKKFPREATRDVYEGADATGKKGCGEYFVTYGGYKVARAAIDEALKHGMIRRKYDLDGYWCLADVAKE